MVDVLALLGSSALVVALGLLMLVDGTVLFGVLVPGDLVVVTAASAFGWPSAFLGAAVAVAALLTAHVASFLVGRRAAGRIRTSRLGRKIGFARWCHAEQVLRVGGDRALVALPFLPVINTVLPVLAGSLGLHPRRFLLLAAVGDVLWVTLWTAIGAGVGALGAGIEADAGWVALVNPFVVSLVVGAAAGVVFAVVLRRAHVVCSASSPAVPRSVIVPTPSAD